MKKLNLIIFVLFNFPLLAAPEEMTKAEKDLNIIEGDYELVKGAVDFCSSGPVGWFNTNKAERIKANEMLMLGTRFIFAKVNQPENKETIGECDYVQKTETKRIKNIGILTETESRYCKGISETTRRIVRVDGDKISLDVTTSNSEAKSSTTLCFYSLKRPSRYQQSIK